MKQVEFRSVDTGEVIFRGLSDEENGTYYIYNAVNPKVMFSLPMSKQVEDDCDIVEINLDTRLYELLVAYRGVLVDLLWLRNERNERDDFGLQSVYIKEVVLLQGKKNKINQEFSSYWEDHEDDYEYNRNILTDGTPLLFMGNNLFGKVRFSGSLVEVTNKIVEMNKELQKHNYWTYTLTLAGDFENTDVEVDFQGYIVRELEVAVAEKMNKDFKSVASKLTD